MSVPAGRLGRLAAQISARPLATAAAATGAAGSVENVQFRMKADGTLLRGVLYIPEAAADGKVPAIIMAHGFGATQTMGFTPLAQAFHSNGYAVLTWDHKSYGASEGMPRARLDWFCQADGYRDAIDFVSGVAAVDPAKIVAWGESFTGGLSLAVGAVDERVAAVIALVPAGLDAVPDTGKADRAKFEQFSRQIVDRTYREAKAKEIGPMPIVMENPSTKQWYGQFIKWVTDQCTAGEGHAVTHAWYTHQGGQDPHWENSTAMVVRKTAVKQGADLAVHFLEKPVLYVTAVKDAVIPKGGVEKAFRVCPAAIKECHEVTGGHFTWQGAPAAPGRYNKVPYYVALDTPKRCADAFEEIATVQLNFLTRLFG